MIPLIKRRKRPVITAAELPTAAQVLALTGLVIAACVPVTRFFHWQINLFLLLLAVVRVVSWRWPAALPPTWLRSVLTLAGVANCLYINHTLVGLDGGAALFATMMMLKLLELNTQRDLRIVVILLGFFIVIQFLFDQALPLALYFSVIVFGMVVLLIALNGGLGAERHWHTALRIAGTYSVQALPLTLVLFVLFPRLTAPLWNLGLESGQAMTGISDSMEPGAIGELALSGELAFRVRFDGAVPPAQQLYWRGPVLWNMDGRRWSPAALSAAAPGRIEEIANPIQYEIVLEPTQQKWLFALDIPISIPTSAQMNADFQLLAPQPIVAAYRYQMQSALTYRIEEPSARRQKLGLQLPPNITPRMRELVASWQQTAHNDWELVQQGLAFFSREQFYYTLLPPRLGVNPTDEFLFVTKKGFCEHYASAFALLMRIGGVPARVVLGYLGGELNQLGGYLMVWQSDAHAWVEVLIAGRGWVRIDPTAAIDPTRIDNRNATRLLGAGQSARFNLNQANMLAQWARTIRLLTDNINAAWQNWVLDFSAQDQFAVLEQLGFGAWREYGLAVLMLAAVTLTLGVTLLALLRQRTTLEPLDAHYARFCQRLARIGLERKINEGPRDFGQRVIIKRPDLMPAVNEFLVLYIPARFSKINHPHIVKQLAQLLRNFHPKKRTPR
jgi:protein-glutamine gamma-glutamyltransferase